MGDFFEYIVNCSIDVIQFWGRKRYLIWVLFLCFIFCDFLVFSLKKTKLIFGIDFSLS